MISQTPPERLSPLTPLAQSSVTLAAAVGLVGRDLMSGDFGFLAVLLVIVAGSGLAAGAFTWWRTRFWLEDSELRIDSGLLVLTSRRIRLDRIGAIDVHRPFTARLLGLARLRLEVAGGTPGEGDLAFLTLTRAREFQQTLQAARAAARQAEAPEAHPPLTDELEDRPVHVLEVDQRLLVLSQLRSVEAGGLALAAAMVVGSFVIPDAAALLAFAGPLALGAGTILLRRFARGYRQKVSIFPDRIEVRGGLLTVTSQVIARHRVQGVVVGEPLGWRGPGWSWLRTASLGSTVFDAESDRTAFVAVLRRDQQAELVAALFGEVPAREKLVRSPRRATWLDPLDRGLCAFGFDPQHVVSSRGFWVRRTDIAQLARVQSIRVVQGPFMRRLRLADLWLDLPTGPARGHLRLRDAATITQERAELLHAWRVVRGQDFTQRD